MLGITHLRHISMITPNFDDQAEFYEKVWGLDRVDVPEEENTVYFRGLDRNIIFLASTREKNVDCTI